MKKLFALLLAMVMVLSLTACGGGRTEAPAAEAKPAENAEAAAPVVEEAGIKEGDVIGVSLPWLGTQNWKEAEEMFKTELKQPASSP